MTTKSAARKLAAQRTYAISCKCGKCAKCKQRAYRRLRRAEGKKG